MNLFARRFSCIIKSQLPGGGGHTVPLNMRAKNSIHALRVRPKP